MTKGFLTNNLFCTRKELLMKKLLMLSVLILPLWTLASCEDKDKDEDQTANINTQENAQIATDTLFYYFAKFPIEAMLPVLNLAHEFMPKQPLPSEPDDYSFDDQSNRWRWVSSSINEYKNVVFPLPDSVYYPVAAGDTVYYGDTVLYNNNYRVYYGTTPVIGPGTVAIPCKFPTQETASMQFLHYKQFSQIVRYQIERYNTGTVTLTVTGLGGHDSDSVAVLNGTCEYESYGTYRDHKKPSDTTIVEKNYKLNLEMTITNVTMKLGTAYPTGGTITINKAKMSINPDDPTGMYGVREIKGIPDFNTTGTITFDGTAVLTISFGGWNTTLNLFRFI